MNFFIREKLINLHKSNLHGKFAISFAAIILFFVGRYAFSIPMLIFLLPLLKLKGGIGLFQLFQHWRLINYLRQTGRYSFRSGANYSKASSNISIDDAYNILGCKKGCTKSEVLSKYKKIMAKLHPDRNDTDTTKLAQMVSEAKETILKNDFS